MEKDPEEVQCPSCGWYHDADGFCQAKACPLYVGPDDPKRGGHLTKHASAPPDLVGMIRTPVPSDRPSGFDTLSPKELDEKKERAAEGTAPPPAPDSQPTEMRSSYRRVLVSGSMAPLRPLSGLAPEDDEEPST